MPLRQIPVAFVLLLGCQDAAPDVCERPRANVAVQIDLSEEGTLVEVCGEGAVWVGESPDLEPRRRLVLRIDDTGALLDESDNPVLGLSGPQLDLRPAEALVGDLIATTRVSVIGNLDADQPIDPTPFDIADPSNTSDFSTSTTVPGPETDLYQVQIYFKKLQDVPLPKWDAFVVTSGVGGEHVHLGTIPLTFELDGAFEHRGISAIYPPWAPEGPGRLRIDLGTPTGVGGTGLDGVRSQDGPSETWHIGVEVVPGTEFSHVFVTDRGELVTMYADRRRFSRGWVLDGYHAWLSSLE